jgi:hypothetical protein
MSNLCLLLELWTAHAQWRAVGAAQVKAAGSPQLACCSWDLESNHTKTSIYQSGLASQYSRQ